MRPLEHSKTRWEETLKHTASSFADLQRAVKFNGPDSPCTKGIRSVCWKTFLLFQDAAPADWSQILLESRDAYASLKERHLHYIKHPELLTQHAADPLADDPESPWDSFRQDELIRAEILQDVRRLPDEPFYHRESTQELILDILFVWVKLNPDVGGYRQGMHELLAPLVFVMHEDSLEAATAGEAVDPIMAGVLDPAFVEHDAFTLFSRVMQRAKGFYETGGSLSNGFTSSYGAPEQNAIVEMSKEIHEVTLMKVDPELATHLKNIEILPQIFLIRWIRLLFGREFPFEQLLILWDTIFAFDPNLDLIPLVCVAMLIRIRWKLLEADYSVALQLLLKYPAPEPPHGPHTFVDDALYLKDHLDFSGGTNLILKYTGRAPSAQPTANTIPNLRPSTPTFAGLGFRQRTLGARSPLTSPSRFVNNRESVEAIFQGAAKNVLERGEKLGINQAVRDAMGEIRRNMQGFQEVRGGASPRSPTRISSTATQMERRNRRLAAMLDETVTALRAVATPGTDDVKDAAAEAVELAAAKIQFVKVYLEDASLALPEDEAMSTLPILHHEQQQPQQPAAAINALTFTSNKENAPSPIVAVDKTVVTMSTASHDIDLEQPSGSSRPGPIILDSPDPSKSDPDRMDTDSPMATPTLPSSAQSPPPPQSTLQRPGAGIPTRSSLAQSSFAWMLDPDTNSPSSANFKKEKSHLTPSSGNSSSSKPPHRNSRSGQSGSRDRNAFLFGEVTSSSGDEGGERERRHPITSEEIFGLEPLRKALPKVKGANTVGSEEEAPL